MEKAYIYIDGFNFYYGLVKNTPYKWLNLKSLFEKIISKNLEISKIKYFTTIVEAFPQDTQGPKRQQVYLEALTKYIPEIEIIYGKFYTYNQRKKLMNPIEDNKGNTIKFVDVVEVKEKRTDINLATHCLNDAWLNLYDWAVIVSNDSDLAEALRFVKEQGKKILLIPPISEKSEMKMKKVASGLRRYAHSVKYIHTSDLSKNQLPEKIPGTNLHKPEEWNKK